MHQEQRRRSVPGRMLTLAPAVVFIVALLSACSGSSSSDKTPAASPGAQPTASLSAAPRTAAPTAGPPLAAQIGARADLPPTDPIDLAARYGKTSGRVPTSKPFAGVPAVGDRRDFFVTKITDSALAGLTPPETVTVSAILLAVSEHAYFYEDVAAGADPSAVRSAADMFEATVWPDITSVFGTPPSPGVDGDPRFIVLQADLGGAAGGYFSGDDLYLRSVRPYSNEAEMVYIDRTLKAGGAGFNVVLAHEFQHLIHAGNDPDEDSWVNEGISEAASGLAGGALTSVKSFEARPETQLNNWESGSTAQYGAGAAFFRYVASRFGGDAALGALTRQPADGEAGVDQFLAGVGSPLRFRDVFADWIAANVLNREAGPYANPGAPLDVRINNSLGVGAPADGTANQFGSDYYALDGLDAGGEFELRFSGRPAVRVLPTDPPSGEAMLWGNAGDDIDTRMTRELDLTNAGAPAFTYTTWFDIEPYYDWGYVSASTDGGTTWQALAGQQTTAGDPVKTALGAGVTGRSGGGTDASTWVRERIDLSPYAGRKILLRLEYVTDGGTHGEGWAVAGAAIEDGAARTALDDTGWRFEGWVRVAAPLPQTYIVRLLVERSDGSAEVRDIPLDADQRGALRFDASGVRTATLVVAGATEGTNEGAPYTIELRRP
ncbi:MAG: immune inhibitor A [Chloroflexi bacterium]|nr:immune inhibitor A [Chloroflexota bacterium]